MKINFKKVIIVILAIIMIIMVVIFINIKFSAKVIEENEALSELLICDCCCPDSVSQIICVDKRQQTLEAIDEYYKNNSPVCDMHPDIDCQLPKLFKYCQVK